MKKKAFLIILDGFGIAPDSDDNAVTQANTPYIDSLMIKFPPAMLKDYGECVGLPEFQTGGSEVGHITIGAGRRVEHLLTKINGLIDSGEFFENAKLKKIFEKAKKKNKIHIMGMASDGGIHSFQPHVYGLLQMAKKYEIPNIYLHLFLDGRDVGERTALQYLTQLEEKIRALGFEKNVKIASVGGRFYAMDRDNNWDRMQQMYDVMSGDVQTHQTKKSTWKQEIENFYQETKKSDYYFPPKNFCQPGKISADDMVINFNFRVDRSRAISEILTDKNFDTFERKIFIEKENYVIFGPYCHGAIEPFHFGEISVKNTLGEILANHQKTQLRISETEKFNHVTYYFSGQQKPEFNGESRVLVPSPKCSSYAQKPEMSAREQMQQSIDLCQKCDFDFVVQNYANADLVGHSGNFDATKKAIEVLDECLEKQVPALQKMGYQIFITADHGNADSMLLPDGTSNASHTKAPVPLIYIPQDTEKKLQSFSGTLENIAPTILDSMGLTVPQEMVKSML